ncbi:acetoin utilization AcuB family protein [Fictibacillus barbaricus]|uniref:Acetoin utilization protein AcuB n=1 Tax=Fictibacillus barbaricus TaxID=182136 RepID=A0ABU1U2V7_9BACL|nr:acetoin utilization AcuB family protein [Fictibacillus barbaricus]MDR7073809.1 acetoin utilization protein AcuB [Fictibacillus barbaricus]
MIVQDMMLKNVKTVGSDTTIGTALQLMINEDIRYLPVIDTEGKLAGLVSDREMKDASPSIFHQNEHPEDFEQPVSTIMKEAVFTAHPFDIAEELSTIFYDQHVGCIPVLEDHKLVGLITEREMLYAFIQLTGTHQPGSHLEVAVKNEAGQLAKVASVLKDFHLNISSVLVYPSKDEKEKIVVFRVGTMNPLPVIEHLVKNGYEIKWPPVPGESNEE